MNVGKMFREEGERGEAAALISKATAPRTWAAMLDAWGALLGTLCSVLDGDQGRALRHDERLLKQHAQGVLPEASTITPLHLRVWRWMWSLPPRSETRKAAFTLGHAALWIERWRTCVTKVPFRPDDGFPICDGYMVGPDDGKTGLQVSDEKARALPEGQAIGQRAEALLRILAWHVDDAKGEAAALRYHGKQAPEIPAWERMYERDTEGRFLICHTPTPLTGGCSWSGLVAHNETGRAILDDHQIAHRHPLDGLGEATRRRFAETAIASLPDGPWTMTSIDVARFADAILEDAAIMSTPEGT